MDSTKAKDLAEREAEATDKETLDDFEESFGDSETGEPVEEDDVKSPDGAFDQSEEHDDAAPM